VKGRVHRALVDTSNGNSPESTRPVKKLSKFREKVCDGTAEETAAVFPLLAGAIHTRRCCSPKPRG
jgi:hypothetical protein